MERAGRSQGWRGGEGGAGDFLLLNVGGDCGPNAGKTYWTESVFPPAPLSLPALNAEQIAGQR